MSSMANHCEVHDLPGSCTQECATLVSLMMGDGPSVDYDPTGCSYGPDRPYLAVQFDGEAKSVKVTTIFPDDPNY